VLPAVFGLAKILASEHGLEAMLPRFLSCLVDAWEAADAGVLLLYDQSDGYLTVIEAQGYDLATLRKIHLSPGEAMSGTAFQTGQAGLYPTPEAIIAARANLNPANRELLAAATAGLNLPRSAVCVPLVTDRARIGAILLESRQANGCFTQPDLASLQSLAYLIALAIENARLNETLKMSQALDEANRLKSELISTLAHEMRTPLTSIKGYATAMLMEETSFDHETQREFLQIIDEECDVLQDLIHDLLESSVIDAGLLELEPQPMRLPHLTGEVIRDVSRRTQKHRFVSDFPEGFPIVDADPNRIAQVLRNLLDNAIKYSPDGGLIVVRGEMRGDEVVVGVADQGIGIAPEHLNRLFEEFFRVQSSLGHHIVGSGLGLPISRAIIESHGGRIWAESQLGEGSTLYFTLPLARPSPKPGEHAHE
jgi:signal transduction histidine kinase